MSEAALDSMHRRQYSSAEEANLHSLRTVPSSPIVLSQAAMGVLGGGGGSEAGGGLVDSDDL